MGIAFWHVFDIFLIRIFKNFLMCSPPGIFIPEGFFKRILHPATEASCGHKTN
jgi:hypothetical protein